MFAGSGEFGELSCEVLKTGVCIYHSVCCSNNCLYQ